MDVVYRNCGPGAHSEGLGWGGGEGEEARKELIVREMKWARAGAPNFSMCSVTKEFKQRF